MRPRGRPVSAPPVFGWEAHAEQLYRHPIKPSMAAVVHSLVILTNGDASVTYARVRRHLRRAGLRAQRKGGV